MKIINFCFIFFLWFSQYYSYNIILFIEPMETQMMEVMNKVIWACITLYHSKSTPQCMI